MAKRAWKVLLHEVLPATQAEPRGSAKLVEQFSVQGANLDAARREAKKSIAARGRTVRAVNLSARPGEPNTLIAYALPKKEPAAPAANAKGKK